MMLLLRLLPLILLITPTKVFSASTCELIDGSTVNEVAKLRGLVVKQDVPCVVQETTAVHELTHALQDQHFDLAKNEEKY